MKISNKILKAINEGIKNSFIIDDDELEIKNNSIFQHEETDYDSLQSKFYYNFLACKLNDKIYYDHELSYNTKKGELIGFCCIPAGVMPDGKPRFAYKKDLIRTYNWGDAIQKCKEIPNGYLPDKEELKTAYINGLSMRANNLYWSSSQFNSNNAYSLSTNKGYIYYDNIHDINYVRPFFHIPQLEGLNESNNFIIDDDELEIENNSIFQHDKIKLSNYEDRKKFQLVVEQKQLAENLSPTDKGSYKRILEIYNEHGLKYFATNETIKPLCKTIQSSEFQNISDDLSWIDTTYVTDMSNLFAYNTLFNYDVSKWNVSNVVSAQYMFSHCSFFNCDLSSWKLDSLQNGAHMFEFCYELKSVPQLTNHELTQDCCYSYMFVNAGIEKAPELPALKLPKAAYYKMFENSNITECPELPATELSYGCYYGMFMKCSKLIEAPTNVMSAKILPDSCYENMFRSCKILSTLPKLPFDSDKNQKIYGWMGILQ